MKPRYKMAVGMFLLVVAFGGVSAGIFVLYGSEVAVYAQLGVVPLLVLAGYVWVNRTVQSTGTSRTEFERRKAREVGEAFGDTWSLAQQLQREYPEGISRTEFERLESHAADLESSGIRFETETGSFEIENREMGSLEELNRLRNEALDLRDWVLTQFAGNIRDRIASINSELERLGSLVGDPEALDPAAVPDPTQTGDWIQTGDRLDECYRNADEIIETACQSIEHTLANAEDAVGPEIEQQLSTARNAVTDRRYREGVTAVVEARDSLQRDVQVDFESQQETTEELLRVAASFPLEDQFGSTYDGTFEAYREELADIDDAMDIAELRELRVEIREQCLDIVVKLQQQLEQELATLESADVPEGWYDRPTAVDEQYEATLRETTGIGPFTEQWERATRDLLDGIDSIESKAGVISGYDRIESIITEQLQTTGEMTADDLPVTGSEEQFLGLYYRKHMADVEFDPDTPKLTAGGGGETYDLHVTAAFPEGGTERELDISLEGPQEERSVTLATPLVAETTFEEVSVGEQTVRVEPAAVAFGPIEERVRVDDETELEFEIERMGLRERLCGDIDIDVDDILPRLSDRLSSRFDESEYLSTEMEFPVDEEYVPCLLVVWADRNGYATEQQGEEVLVYDSDTVRKQIENVIEYNLAEGEAKRYETLRTEFLSAPVSDRLVRQLAERANTDVTIEPDRLVKE